jgi:apolipoprotein N-acyltransferase
VPSALLLTALSAVLYAAAFPPWSLAPAAWVALVPWLVAAARVAPARAAVLGLCWGVAIGFGTGSSLIGMVASYFGLPAWAGWASLLGVSATLAGAPCAAFSAWLSWLARRGRASPVLVGASFALCELARARGLGNPWATVAAAQVDTLPVQIAALVGPSGVALLVGAVNGALAAAVEPRLRGPRPLHEAALVGFATLAATLYGGSVLARDAHGVAHDVGVDAGAPAALRVAVVQGAVRRDLAWRPEYRRHGLERHLALTSRVTSPVDLVVWPESAVSFYPQEPSAERDALLARTRSPAPPLVLGAPHHASVGGVVQYHNSVFALAGGRLVARYDKQRLVPFAEAPLLGVAAASGATFSPGPARAPLDVAGHRLGAFVCFEAMDAAFVRRLVRDGADLLVNLSNDAWFGSEPAARHHLQHARLRAIETRRALVRATTTGHSALIDPHGRLVARSAFDAPDVLQGVVATRTDLTPYARLGDWPVVVAFALALALVLRLRG